MIVIIDLILIIVVGVRVIKQLPPLLIRFLLLLLILLLLYHVRNNRLFIDDLVSLLAALLFEFLKLSDGVAVHLFDSVSLVARDCLSRQVGLGVVEFRRLVVLLGCKIKVVGVLVVT